MDEEHPHDRAARLIADSEHVYTRTVRRRQALAWAADQAAAVRATAASDDGAVRVTVDRAGLLTGLELTPDVLRRPATVVANLILAVTQHAAADARGQVRDAYQCLVDERVLNQLPRDLPPVAAPPSTPAEDEDEGEPHSWLSNT